jgi:hypothetical protein
MKNVAILALLFVINISCFAQFDISFYGEDKDRNITQEDVDILRKTTTVILYRESDEYDIDQLKEVLSSVWKITKLELVNYNEIGNYQNNENYSFLLNSLVYSYPLACVSAYNFNLSLVHFRRYKKKDYYLPYTYARISQHLSATSFAKFISIGNIDKGMGYLNTEAFYYDNMLGYLKNSLQYLNDILEKIDIVKKVDIDEKRCKYNNLKNLTSGVLYIPEFATEWLTLHDGTQAIRNNVEEIFKEYKFKYKVVPDTELSSLILESEEPIYYLITRRAYNVLFINIVNSKTGEIIYSESKLTRGIKSKHIKKLNTCISKSINKANREESIL